MEYWLLQMGLLALEKKMEAVQRLKQCFGGKASSR